jgi:O-antigen/teichoic acid export membrane protein
VSVGGGAAGAGGGALGAAVTAGWAAYGAVAVFGALRGAAPGLRATVRDGFRGARAAAREWRGFRAWGTVGTVASTVREAAVPALVAALYGPAAAGVLFVAQRVLQAPMALAAEAVSRAWFGTAAEIVRTGAPGMQAAFGRITRGLIAVGGPIIGAAAVAGPFLFSFVFGSDLDDGGELLVVLAPLYLAMLVSVPSGQALIALGRTRLTAAVLISRLVVAAVAIASADALGLGLTWAVGLYAAGMVVISLALGVIAWRLTGEADAARPG